MSDQKSEPSKEFTERMTVLEKEKEVAKFKHDLIMEELAYRRQSENIHHEKDLERGRIRNAEEKKLIMLKAQEIRRARGE